MKKLIALLMAAVMVLSFSACGQTATAQPAAEESGAGNVPTAAAEEKTAEFPTKEITIICPFSAGGGTDALARKLASLSEAELGQPVIVVNKTGGSGAVGMGEGAAASPDGYTVTMVTVECVLLPAAGLASFTTDDFTPIIRVNFDPAALFVRADSEYQTLDDFINAAKEKPGVITLMTDAYPAKSWLCGALLQEEAGVEFNIIPEAGGASEQISSLMGGHVEATLITPAEGAAYIESGDLRMLAVANSERDAKYPDVPTFIDCGYNVEVGTWRGFVVPKNTPTEIVKVLNDAFTAAYETADMTEFLESSGFGAGYLNSEDFTALLKQQTEQYTPIIQKYANN